MRPVPIDGEAAPEGPALRPLEREALTLLLVNPALTAGLSDDEVLPIRDEAGRALAGAWQAAVREAGGRPDLEAFVSGLDPATADLARSLLAYAKARGIRPDLDTDREALRVTLLRLRVEEVEGRLDDLQTLIRAASEDGEGNDIRTLEQQFQELTREREQLVRGIRGPATAVGARRS
jgi:hypothetical protein